jgi:hypothetical protein
MTGEGLVKHLLALGTHSSLPVPPNVLIFSPFPLHTHTHTHTHTHNSHKYSQTHTYASTDTHSDTHILNTYGDTHVHVQTLSRTHTCTHSLTDTHWALHQEINFRTFTSYLISSKPGRDTEAAVENDQEP